MPDPGVSPLPSCSPFCGWVIYNVASFQKACLLVRMPKQSHPPLSLLRFWFWNGFPLKFEDNWIICEVTSPTPYARWPARSHFLELSLQVLFAYTENFVFLSLCCSFSRDLREEHFFFYWVQISPGKFFFFFKEGCRIQKEGWELCGICWCIHSFIH